RPESGHDGHDTLAALHQLRVEHTLGGVVDRDDERLPLLGDQREPPMAAAVQMHQFAPARPRLAAPAVPPPRPAVRQQAGLLQRRLHVGVGQRYPVLAPGDLVEVPRIEADVLLAIEPQEPLDFGEGRPAWRRPPAAAVEQPEVAITRKAPAPAPHTARRAADDVRRLDPGDLAAHCPQYHLTNRHGPLQGHWRIEHAGPPSRHSDSPGLAERTDHLLRKADRSCAPYRSSPGPLDGAPQVGLASV